MPPCHYRDANAAIPRYSHGKIGEISSKIIEHEKKIASKLENTMITNSSNFPFIFDSQTSDRQVPVIYRLL